MNRLNSENKKKEMNQQEKDKRINKKNKRMSDRITPNSRRGRTGK